MFKTTQTPYNIVDWTPFRRDPLQELADACHAAGVKLFFYYSQLDWHHPDYWPSGRTAWDNGRPDHGDWSRYLTFMNAQLAELLTRYGEVGGIWFDGMWDKPDAPWQLDSTYTLIHRLQPAALVLPNHHQPPRSGEDAQTFEQDLPGANTAGFNTSYVSADVPLETSLTMNDSWGFNITDKDFKSVRTLVGYLVRAAGNGANLLLNVGPRPDGTIGAEFTARLDSLGEWLRVYGTAIYGTRAGPVPPRSWGATTRRGDTVFVHVLDWPDPLLTLPPLGARVRAAYLLRGRAAVPAPGSAKTAGMAICPCSMGTVAAIAHGTSRSLVERAADVTLKERRQLILVPRETPLSLVHLRNLTLATEAGAIVLPAAPGFYHKPQKVSDLVDFVVQRVLDHLGLEINLVKRWDGK